MASLIHECPKCQHRQTTKKIHCKCGNDLSRAKGKKFGVRWRNLDGIQRQEMVGPSRSAAEEHKRQIESRLANQTYIDHEPGSSLTLHQLFEWYLNLPEVLALSSYGLQKTSIKNLSKRLNINKKVSKLTYSELCDYQSKRMNEPSPVYPGRKIAPKTVREELACLRTILNKALYHERIAQIPLTRFPMVKVSNVRERILTELEWDRLQSELPTWLWRITFIAYHTGMRQGEILSLNWRQVDLKDKFIRLQAENTKTSEARSVRLSPEVVQMMKEIPRAIHTQRVFLSPEGKAFERWTTYINRTWKKSLESAGIDDFRFHDLRHCFATRAMRAGNPAYLVMKQVGHKTESMLRRYHLIDESDLKNLLFSNSANEKKGTAAR